MSMFSNVAIGGYIEKMLAQLEKDKELPAEQQVENIKKIMKEDKKACDTGWY
jgi:hypothetical protein